MKKIYEVKNTSFWIWLCFQKYSWILFGQFWDSIVFHGFYFGTQKNEKWIVGALGQANRETSKDIERRTSL